MERRIFIKYTSLAGIGAGLFPMAAIGKVGVSGTSQLIQFSAASTQIRHGALNLPFAKLLKEELPFDWLLDVHQNIFFKDGFQRNVAEDMHIMSVALKEGEGFEALQINIQPDQVSFLWKEQYLSVDDFAPRQKLELADKQYAFQLASLEKGQKVDIDMLEYKTHFVQVLEGEVQNQTSKLNSNTGLGILSEPTDSLTLVANRRSRVLMISHL